MKETNPGKAEKQQNPIKHPPIGRKRIQMPLAVFLLFLLSAIIRGLILPNPHLLVTYYDELLYWSVAKNFWTEPAFTVFHMPVVFSKFLYSMVLSPLFLIKDPVVRTQSAMWLNAVIISLSVFPAYRIAKRITASAKIQLVSLVLFLCSPIMNYAEKYGPESLYLPMALYLIAGYYSLYQRVNEPESCAMLRLNLHAALLGIFAYLTYVGKEAGSAFFGGFLFASFIMSAISHRQKTNTWKRYLSAAFSHFCAAAIVHVLLRLLLPMQFSYGTQMSLSNIDTMYKIEYLIRCFISNSLYLCAAFFGIPALLWQLKRNRRGRLAEDGPARCGWLLMLYTALVLTLVFLSYSVSVKEELGNANIRLHTRYFIPFLFPLLALMLEEIRRTPARLKRASVSRVLLVGVSCILLLTPNRYVAAYDSYDTWHIQNSSGLLEQIKQPEDEADGTHAGEKSFLARFFADQTAGSKEITYHHGLILTMSVFTGIMVLIVLLTRKSKRIALALFCCLVLAIEGYNNIVSVDRIGSLSTISSADAQAYRKLDKEIMETVGNESLLIINASKTEGRKRLADTFFSFDWYSVLTKDVSKALGPEGIIDLNKTQLSVSMPFFTGSGKYPEGTVFSYVLCSGDIRFHEGTVEPVFFSPETGYFLSRVINPGFLDVDYIRDYYEE